MANVALNGILCFLYADFSLATKSPIYLRPSSRDSPMCKCCKFAGTEIFQNGIMMFSFVPAQVPQCKSNQVSTSWNFRRLQESQLAVSVFSAILFFWLRRFRGHLATFFMRRPFFVKRGLSDYLSRVHAVSGQQ